MGRTFTSNTIESPEKWVKRTALKSTSNRVQEKGNLLPSFRNRGSHLSPLLSVILEGMGREFAEKFAFESVLKKVICILFLRL